MTFEIRLYEVFSSCAASLVYPMYIVCPVSCCSKYITYRRIRNFQCTPLAHEFRLIQFPLSQLHSVRFIHNWMHISWYWWIESMTCISFVVAFDGMDNIVQFKWINPLSNIYSCFKVVHTDHWIFYPLRCFDLLVSYQEHSWMECYGQGYRYRRLRRCFCWYLKQTNMLDSLPTNYFVRIRLSDKSGMQPVEYPPQIIQMFIANAEHMLRLNHPCHFID